MKGEKVNMVLELRGLVFVPFEEQEVVCKDSVYSSIEMSLVGNNSWILLAKYFIRERT